MRSSRARAVQSRSARCSFRCSVLRAYRQYRYSSERTASVRRASHFVRTRRKRAFVCFTRCVPPYFLLSLIYSFPSNTRAHHLTCMRVHLCACSLRTLRAATNGSIPRFASNVDQLKPRIASKTRNLKIYFRRDGLDELSKDEVSVLCRGSREKLENRRDCTRNFTSKRSFPARVANYD